MKPMHVFAAAYLLCIVGANWALQRWGIISVGGLVVPAGVWFAGLSFGLRDALHERTRRRWVVLLIAAGAVLSWWISPVFAIASGAAFLLSEILDMAVYDRFRRRRWTVAVVTSNIVGSCVDSAVFLSLAFGSVNGWVDLTIGKALMVLPALPIVAWARRPGEQSS